ncbi:MAG TPA: ABC transporter permease [Candidatus Gallacutalibacter stercoravium]|nr:ABC transporter permease [Candidatus Gallacutalibacter stercoravium]
MTLRLETKKLKRTRYFPAFLAGGLLAAAFPLINMLVRSESFTALPGEPFTILMDANWQMMAMLNILVCICGACMMYHTEYADNGAQKMDVLPVRAGKLFLTKFVVNALALALMIILETAALTWCAVHWFSGYEFDALELLQGAGFQWFVTLPTVMLMLVIASACKNMWVSLGIGVVLVFTMCIFPQDNLILSLCPFSSPYQTLAMAAESSRVPLFLGVCAAEVVVLGLLGLVYQKIRRCAE